MGDNEAKSAEVFDECLRRCTVFLGKATCENAANGMDTVRRGILATKDHFSCPADTPEVIKYFLDMDVAILGASAATYCQYADQVRLEYSHVVDSAFAEGRITFLEKCLSQENIYKTEHFRALYEQSARDNIEHEINNLQLLQRHREDEAMNQLIKATQLQLLDFEAVRQILFTPPPLLPSVKYPF
eukprot:TRINITY_DN23730_c0_g1_i1.p1 TRINITY_DN23730_c0_g1~~TRINITY_DN23730_c0_g1_i1.p1  ORF type:complete len:196 (+),score=29.35 TRINITY_DN23730_c0_g1_i1:32-589(+)